MDTPVPAVGGYEAGTYLPPPTTDPSIRSADALNLARDQWRRDLKSLREIIETRLDAQDTATNLRLDLLLRIPAETDKLVANQALLHRQDVDRVTEAHAQDVLRLDMRFDERDVRAVMIAESSQKALDAGLVTAAEKVALQNESNSKASEKLEASTAKQIDGLLALVKNGFSTEDEKIGDIKDRVAALENMSGGRAQERASVRETVQDARGSYNVILGIIGAVVAVAILALTIYSSLKP